MPITRAGQERRDKFLFAPCDVPINCRGARVIYIDKDDSAITTALGMDVRVPVRSGAIVVAHGADQRHTIHLVDQNGRESEAYALRQGLVIPGPFEEFFVRGPIIVSDYTQIRGQIELITVPCIEEACCLAAAYARGSKPTRYAIRASLIPTTSYVIGSVPEGLLDAGYTRLSIEMNFTLGSLTSGQLRVRWANRNDNVFFQQLTNTVSAGSESLALSEYTFTAGGTYMINVPIQGNIVEIAVKGTGTLTGSLFAVDAVAYPA